MENASRALLIAGGVLISIIIISMLVLMVNNLSHYRTSKEDIAFVDEIVKFNSQYLPYDRDGTKGNDIRGNELLTLANKIIDYNRRKSTAGTVDSVDGTIYDGSNIGYKPLTLIVKLDDRATKLITGPDTSEHKIFIKTEYKASDIVHNLEEPFSKIDKIIKQYPSEDTLNKLATGYTKIFIKESDYSDPDKYNQSFRQAVSNFNMCFGKTILRYSETDSTINDESKAVLEGGDLDLNKGKSGGTNYRNVRQDVSDYYEYMQFKRARFRCIEFDTTTDEDGRVTKIVLEYLQRVS